MDYRRLLNIEEAAELAKIDQKMIQGWVDAKIIPHYFVCKNGPLFARRELLDWIETTQIRYFEGKPVPRIVSIITRPVEDFRGLPLAIQSIEGICQYKFEAGCSGVYFLCNGPEIIYIGQSISVASRITFHLEHAEFRDEIDGVYYLPLNSMGLLEMETKLINEIKPKYNKTIRNNNDQK